MSEPLLTKRLHISGLTPSIKPADLERRLSSFGAVKAMDGFGARDALGDARKFGFVTMEIGAKELAKCLNALSGSTWKGAKLRIGEAKPDFRERLAQINARPPLPVRPKRIRARDHGYPSSALPLKPLSIAAAASAPGWIITPSGRVVRPMRMRPERPLEPMRTELTALKTKGMNGKVKKHIKPPPVRARRRLIDPTKWDSICIKGVFLDAVPTPPQSVPQEHARTISSIQKSPVAAVATSSRRHEATEPTGVRDEANAALAMLDRMFGDKEDWDGRESVDGMGEDSGAYDDEMQFNAEDDIEVVPRDVREGKMIKNDKGKGKEKSGENRLIHEDEVDVEAARDVDMEMEETDPTLGTMQAAEPAPRTNLKALFAPREDASFSLVNHLDLDLDLELDADVLGISAPSGTTQENGSSGPQVVELPTASSTAKARSRVMLDPSLPLLFPTPDSLPHAYTPSGSTTTTHHSTPSCFLFPSMTRVRHLYHLPPSATLTRSPQDTSESIRERWEKDKGHLTREWKKAWREARGSKRGRGAVEGDVGGGY